MAATHCGSAITHSRCTTPYSSRISVAGAAYSAELAFFNAATPSSNVISGVVFTALTAPLDEIAIDSAAALTASGISQTSNTSYSPKLNQPLMTRPPSFSTTGRTASRRFAGAFTSAVQATGV